VTWLFTHRALLLSPARPSLGSTEIRIEGDAQMTTAAMPRHPGAWTLPEMAPDQPLLPDCTTRPGALQRLGISVVASEIVLNHLDCVENGLADVPLEWPDTADLTGNRSGVTSRPPGGELFPPRGGDIPR
jgi:hypothetical protein